MQKQKVYPKLMFMAAVARPRWIASKKQWFNGLIDIWHIHHIKVPAKRNSKNRAKGILETKPIENINSAEHQKMMESNIIPAIKLKWPTQDETVWIHQDNAKPHSQEEDKRIEEIAAADEGCQIKIKRQPPNSPDLNVLDLGVFAAIQALEHQ